MDERRKIKSFILQNFLFTDDDAAVSDSDSLIARGVIDSTGILELILFLEESIGIKVQEDEMVPSNFDSIDSIVSFVARRAGS
ncbi:MAG: acyl carrier protein [Pseudomonadota bacterium]